MTYKVDIFQLKSIVYSVVLGPIMCEAFYWYLMSVSLYLFILSLLLLSLSLFIKIVPLSFIAACCILRPIWKT